MGSVPRAKSGVGSAVNDLSRELGGALGIAVLGSVMNSVYRSRITGRLSSLPPEVQEQANASVATTFQAARDHPAHANLLLDAGRDVFSHAFGRAMLLGVAIVLCNALCVWTFQGRHRGAVAPDPASPTAPDPDGSVLAATPDA